MYREGYKKHWKEFKAWIDGYEVEMYRAADDTWVIPDFYTWSKDTKYRIKPFEPKNGDTILVSNDEKTWRKAVFIRKDRCKHYCYKINDSGGVSYTLEKDGKPIIDILEWKYIKPLNSECV